MERMTVDITENEGNGASIEVTYQGEEYQLDLLYDAVTAEYDISGDCVADLPNDVWPQLHRSIKSWIVDYEHGDGGEK